MGIGNPATAPPRDDLPFIRTRGRQRPAATPQPATPQPATPQPATPQPATPQSAAPQSAAPQSATPALAARQSGPIDYTRHSTAKAAPAGTPPTAPAPAAMPPSHGIDYSRPDRRTPPPPPPPPRAAPPPPPPRAAPPPRTAPPPRAVPASPPAGSTIDFNRPGRQPSSPAPAAPAASSSSLDLSGAAPAAASARPVTPPLRVHGGARVAGQDQFLLGPDSPTVTLTRVQSGVGRLTIEAVCSAEIGDLRLGALYQLRSGGSSTVQLAGGNRFGPSARRPVVVAAHEEYERLALDLRQVGDIERIAVYAFSEARRQLTWGGTLVVTLFGGARIELPLETLPPSAVAVLLTLYNLDGELVLRGELEAIAGDVREAARAYGYDRITWRDDRTPVD